MPALHEPVAATLPAVPLLPDDYLSAAARPPAVTPTTPGTAAPTAPLAATATAAAAARYPAISLASLGGAVAALGEADGGKAADALGLGGAVAGANEAGAVRQVWSGFLDDLLGAKKVAASEGAPAGSLL